MGRMKRKKCFSSEEVRRVRSDMKAHVFGIVRITLRTATTLIGFELEVSLSEIEF